MTSSVEPKRRSPPTPLILLPETQESPAILRFFDCHMPEQHLNLRKRQLSEQCPLQPNGTVQAASKKQRLSYPSGPQPPSAFWDNLSKIWLTKHALKELNRRNTEIASSPLNLSYKQTPRRVSRVALAELKEVCKPSQCAADFLRNCVSTCLKDVQRLSRHGGPDLSDLRGVSIITHLPVLELTFLSAVSQIWKPSSSHNDVQAVQLAWSKTGFYIHFKHNFHH